MVVEELVFGEGPATPSTVGKAAFAVPEFDPDGAAGALDAAVPLGPRG